MFFKAKRVARIVCVAIFLMGVIWFLLPIMRSVFGIGSIFGICVCVLGVFLLLNYKKIADLGPWRKAGVRFVTFCYVVGLAWCIYLTILMCSVTAQSPPKDADVIVLGAQVQKNGTLSLSLRQRVNRAFQYLTENPDAVCIVTGGQGGNEPETEAQAQKNALVDLGIDPSRIYMEDQSHNTKENFDYALKLIERQGLGDTYAVVTQDFHMYRSLQLGKAAQLNVYSLSVTSDPLMYPSYYGRELLSLTKWHLQVLFDNGG